MKPVGVKSGIYVEFHKETNKEDYKFNFGDNVNISKHKKHFCKKLPSEFF